MATVITAGNATNGLSFNADNTGSFEFKTGTGAGTTAITVSSAQVVNFAAAPTGAGMLTSGTSVSASGTSVDFTSIPSWVKRITVMFSGVSTNGTSQTQIQLGDAGGFETSGYVGTTGYNASYVNYSSGFTFDTASSVSAATVRYGAMILNYVGSNMWVVCGTGGTGGSAVFYFGGAKTLSDTLTQVRITTVNGTDTFDLGSINILYE
jgi:hypothetical protein